MAATYEPIATSTTTGTSTITFSSIPATYTDLILVATGYENAGGGGYFALRLNGDTGTNYSRTALRGNGSSPSSARGTNETAWYPDFATDSSAVILHIMNYANTNTYKTSIGRFNQTTVSTVGQVNLWRSTSAINEVKLLSSAGGNTLIGTFTLYGIKAAI